MQHECMHTCTHTHRLAHACTHAHAHIHKLCINCLKFCFCFVLFKRRSFCCHCCPSASAGLRLSRGLNSVPLPLTAVLSAIHHCSPQLVEIVRLLLGFCPEKTLQCCQPIPLVLFLVQWCLFRTLLISFWNAPFWWRQCENFMESLWARELSVTAPLCLSCQSPLQTMMMMMIMMLALSWQRWHWLHLDEAVNDVGWGCCVYTGGWTEKSTMQRACCCEGGGGGGGLSRLARRGGVTLSGLSQLVLLCALASLCLHAVLLGRCPGVDQAMPDGGTLGSFFQFPGVLVDSTAFEGDLQVVLYIL